MPQWAADAAAASDQQVALSRQPARGGRPIAGGSGGCVCLQGLERRNIQSCGLLRDKTHRAEIPKRFVTATILGLKRARCWQLPADVTY